MPRPPSILEEHIYDDNENTLPSPQKLRMPHHTKEPNTVPDTEKKSLFDSCLKMFFCCFYR